MRPGSAGVLALLVTLCSSWAWAQKLTEPTAAQQKARRCWEKTALALVGSPRAAAFGRDDAGFPPEFEPSRVALYFGDAVYQPTFANRFAGFVNSKWQPEQSTDKPRNVPYLLARHVVGNNLKWREVFVGHFDIDFTEGRGAVVPADSGLGYFRVGPWQRQYAGNEVAGYKLSTAYRLLNNIVGVKLTPAANNTLGDASATGRAAPGCSGCHFNGSYPLDLIARVLTRRQGFGESMTFVAPTDGPQQLFGQTMNSDADVVTALVNSPAFVFNTCRLTFEFMYGRPESTCEAPIFEACVSAFEAEGTIRSAILGIVQHPDYCQ